jgi:hypothetical protein
VFALTAMPIIVVPSDSAEVCFDRNFELAERVRGERSNSVHVPVDSYSYPS